MGVQDIYDRSYIFAKDILKFVRVARLDSVSRPLGLQLIRSATSVGANLQEAFAASSRRDFINKISIALREARESCYWLRLLHDSDDNLDKAELKKHIQEARELANILGKIKVSSLTRETP